MAPSSPHAELAAQSLIEHLRQRGIILPTAAPSTAWA